MHMEQSFAFGIRQEIVRVRPDDLDRVFHPWTPQEVSSRDAMYSRKLGVSQAREGVRSYLRHSVLLIILL
jgi:hypothetical protein